MTKLTTLSVPQLCIVSNGSTCEHELENDLEVSDQGTITEYSWSI
jgi:hypothetical protein